MNLIGFGEVARINAKQRSEYIPKKMFHCSRNMSHFQNYHDITRVCVAFIGLKTLICNGFGLASQVLSEKTFGLEDIHGHSIFQ